MKEASQPSDSMRRRSAAIAGSVALTAEDEAEHRLVNVVTEWRGRGPQGARVAYAHPARKMRNICISVTRGPIHKISYDLS